jgi:hypothetical protein
MTNLVIRSSVVLTATLAFVAAGIPAQARAAEQGNTIQSSAQPDSAKETQKRYCVVDTVTGSRIPLKVCKSKKEWEDEGVQIPASR